MAERGSSRGRGGKDGKDGKGKKRGGGKRSLFRKKRPPADMTFDYKEVEKLTPFLTEEGKIVPGRVSGLRSGQQRQLTLAVKRARNVGFLNAINRRHII